MADPMKSGAKASEDITWEAAEAAMKLSEERFQAQDIEGVISGFHDNVVIRFTSLPEIRGKDAARRWLRMRFERQLNYIPRKVLLAVNGQAVTRSWTGRWIDAPTGRSMEGRGIEFLKYEGGKVILLDACFNVWEQGKRRQSEYFEMAE